MKRNISHELVKRSEEDNKTNNLKINKPEKLKIENAST